MKPKKKYAHVVRPDGSIRLAMPREPRGVLEGEFIVWADGARNPATWQYDFTAKRLVEKSPNQLNQQREEAVRRKEVLEAAVTTRKDELKEILLAKLDDDHRRAFELVLELSGISLD